MDNISSEQYGRKQRNWQQVWRSSDGYQRQEMVACAAVGTKYCRIQSDNGHYWDSVTEIAFTTTVYTYTQPNSVLVGSQCHCTVSLHHCGSTEDGSGFGWNSSFPQWLFWMKATNRIPLTRWVVKEKAPLPSGGPRWKTSLSGNHQGRKEELVHLYQCFCRDI